MFQKDKLFWLLVEASPGIKQLTQLGSEEMYDLLDYLRNFYRNQKGGQEWTEN